jgi:mRNA-degrading endonuclease toxin of MazEF toxin-antitoxin module
MRTPERGEIWGAAIPVDGAIPLPGNHQLFGKRRPSVVISDTDFNREFRQATVVAITAYLRKDNKEHSPHTPFNPLIVPTRSSELSGHRSVSYQSRPKAKVGESKYVFWSLPILRSPSTNLDEDSLILCAHLWTAGLDQLGSRRGKVSPECLSAVEYLVDLLLCADGEQYERERFPRGQILRMYWKTKTLYFLIVSGAMPNHRNPLGLFTAVRLYEYVDSNLGSRPPDIVPLNLENVSARKSEIPAYLIAFCSELYTIGNYSGRAEIEPLGSADDADMVIIDERIHGYLNMKADVG